MSSVDGEQIKLAYLKLSAQERREVAHWILARELSGRAGASLKAPAESSTTINSPAFPVKTILISILGIFLIAAISWAGLRWLGSQKDLRKKQTAAQLAAEEAKRPNSPANLEFLERNIGNEITIRGIPQDSEVGYLYFSKSHKKALRLNLFVAGVVLFQSGDLEEFIQNKQEVEVQGVLEKTPDGYYQISVSAQNRLKKLNP